jgi:hypothetical protein
MINIIFLIIYAFFSGYLPATELYYVLSLQCLLLIVTHLQKRRKITPIFLYYVGVLLVNYSNLALIEKSRLGTISEYSYLIPRYIDLATQIWCISTTCIIIGYQMAVNKSLPPIGFETPSKKVLNTIFYSIIIVRTLAIFGTRIPFLSGPLLKIFILVNSAAILFYSRLWAKEKSHTYRIYAIALWTIETYAALKSAFLRFELILPTVYLFTGYFVGKGNMRFLLTYRVIPFLIVISVYSSVFKSLQKNRNNFYAVIFENAVDDKEKDKENSGALLERSSNLAQLTAVCRLVNSNGFYNGKASQPLIAAVIPRAIWPDKPLVQLGAWFALEITGTSNAVGPGQASSNSVNMSVPGELYLDFGWIGIIIGSVLFGAFFPLLWNATDFYSSEYNLTGTVFGGYLLVVAGGGLGADLQIVITLVSIYVSLFLIKKIVKK